MEKYIECPVCGSRISREIIEARCEEDADYTEGDHQTVIHCCGDAVFKVDFEYRLIPKIEILETKAITLENLPCKQLKPCKEQQDSLKVFKKYDFGRCISCETKDKITKIEDEVQI